MMYQILCGVHAQVSYINLLSIYSYTYISSSTISLSLSLYIYISIFFYIIYTSVMSEELWLNLNGKPEWGLPCTRYFIPVRVGCQTGPGLTGPISPHHTMMRHTGWEPNVSNSRIGGASGCFELAHWGREWIVLSSVDFTWWGWDGDWGWLFAKPTLSNTHVNECWLMLRMMNV